VSDLYQFEGDQGDLVDPIPLPEPKLSSGSMTATNWSVVACGESAPDTPRSSVRAPGPIAGRPVRSQITSQQCAGVPQVPLVHLRCGRGGVGRPAVESARMPAHGGAR
jgi:hypothetical protein